MSWRRRFPGGSNGGYSFDQRTGFRVEGRKLKQDAEKGVWTTDPDPIHPQRFVRVPGPDGGRWQPGMDKNESHGDDWVLKTFWWTIENGFQQRPQLLVRIDKGRGFDVEAGAEFGIGAAIAAAANPLTFQVFGDGPGETPNADFSVATNTQLVPVLLEDF